MKPQTIPAMQIEPDLFGKLNISVAIEGYEATPNGVMKWIADAARLNRNFIPSLASRDIAERLNISRRTLEGYRTGIKVPVVTCWLLKVLLEEIRNNASGLVLSSTPSETATREDAGQGHLFDEVGKTMVKLSKARRKGGKGSDTQSKATATRKQKTATKKKKDAKTKKHDAPTKPKSSPKKSNTTKSKSKSSK
jgi:hypothetical protein